MMTTSLSLFLSISSFPFNLSLSHSLLSLSRSTLFSSRFLFDLSLSLTFLFRIFLSIYFSLFAFHSLLPIPIFLNVIPLISYYGFTLTFTRDQTIQRFSFPTLYAISKGWTGFEPSSETKIVPHGFDINRKLSPPICPRSHFVLFLPSPIFCLHSFTWLLCNQQLLCSR